MRDTSSETFKCLQRQITRKEAREERGETDDPDTAGLKAPGQGTAVIPLMHSIR